MYSNYPHICTQVLALDDAIRFAGIATREARIAAAMYREGVVPLLTTKEAELSMVQSVMRMSIRYTMEEKFGYAIYATAVYEKVKRATITLFDDRGDCESFLLVSFDAEANHEEIITKKILPFLKEIGKGLMPINPQGFSS